MPRLDEETALRTLTRIIFVLALSLTIAVPASAAVDPADRAWITAAGSPVTDWELEFPGLGWNYEATVRSTGPLPGREGNRHTANAVFVHGYSRFPIPWAVTVTDEQCSATCTVVRTEALSLYDSQATVTGPAADGTLRVVAADPAVDVTITPIGWRDPRDPPDLSTSTIIARNQSALEDRVITYVEEKGEQARVTGSIAGVPAQEVLKSSWAAGGRGIGTVGPPLRPTTDRATLLQYAPPQTRGRVIDRTTVGLEYGAVARGTLTTSAGVRLRGNAFQILFYPQLELRAGEALVGTRSSDVGIMTYQCPAADTPLTECEYYEHAEIQKINSSGPLRYGVTPLGALALQIAVPVTREVDEGQSPDVPLGTVTFTAALAPTGAGRPERAGDLNYASPGSWITSRTLERNLTGPARLGSLTARPVGAPFVRLTSTRTGAL